MWKDRVESQKGRTKKQYYVVKGERPGGHICYAGLDGIIEMGDRRGECHWRPIWYFESTEEAQGWIDKVREVGRGNCSNMTVEPATEEVVGEFHYQPGEKDHYSRYF